MRGHPARDVYPDRGNFSAWCVHAGQAGNAKRFDIKVVHRANQDLFQITYEAMHVFAIRAQINNWIADDLTEPVISNLSTPVGFKDSKAAFAQDFSGSNDGCLI